jgi:hypothetical protein
VSLGDVGLYVRDEGSYDGDDGLNAGGEFMSALHGRQGDEGLQFRGGFYSEIC